MSIRVRSLPKYFMELNVLMSHVMATVQSGAAGRGKGFVTCFLRVPLGYYSCYAAQASKENFQKTCYKTSSSTCRPRLYLVHVIVFQPSGYPFSLEEDDPQQPSYIFDPRSILEPLFVRLTVVRHSIDLLGSVHI